MAEGSGSRILVVGCGAIGGVVAGHLQALGQDVSVLTTNPEIARALRKRGVRLSGEDAREPTPCTVLEALEPGSPGFDFVLLATQPPQVEAAAQSARAALTADGRMVCFQNGLCEERVAAIVGEERVIGAVVAWGASMPEPGLYERTSAGGFSVGRLDSGSDARLEELARLLEVVGPVSVTENLRGARWSKLALNCAISTLGTIGGDRLGALLRHRYVRRLALEVMTEVVAVARAEDVKLEKVAGTLDLDWIALTEAERTAAGSAGLLAKHSLLLAVGARYRRLRSSMLAAIERGRPPAVDFLNGEVVSRAGREAVWAIARGELQPSHAALRGLWEQTR
jgi:2-dehydropantoate 2-reductase